MTLKKNIIIYFLPRILSIIFICFLALFSLDVFDGSYGLWETILAFLMHNIPVFILTAALVISWKYEIVGGVVFTVAGILYTFMILPHSFEGEFGIDMILGPLLIAGPAFLIGILFLINWRKKNTLGK